MALLSRSAILEADDLTTEDVEVPEWGGSVRIRALTGVERDRLEASMLGKNGQASAAKMANFRARIVATCMVDENGDSVFGTADVVALGAKSAAALERVSEAAQRLSGLSETDVDELAGE